MNLINYKNKNKNKNNILIQKKFYKKYWINI